MDILMNVKKIKTMKHTIDTFIKELQSISEDKRKLPLVIDCPNGLQVSPSIKMRWDDSMELLNKKPDKMVITWRD